ncbi:MAG: tetratricopeptide repeat protein [Planctomycetaceae bacterium]|jgi:tetratricopeptide (TPR) repeat protein|nr:tetratricopeptide repeat protein [Planctomycetaceae bacterium]
MFYKLVNKSKKSNLMLCKFVILLSLFLLNLAAGCKLPQSFNPLTTSRLRSVELEHLGNTALERGDNQTAEKYLSEALRLNRRDVELRRSYAESLWQQDKKNEAIAQLQYTQKHGGQNNVALNISLAEKLLVSDDIDGAYAQADEAVRLAPQDARGWALRGKATLIKVQKELDAQSKNPSPTIELANHERPNQPPHTNPPPNKISEQIIKSRNDYYRAISIDPQNRNILADLAKIQLLAGQPEHSLVTLQNLQDQYPPDSLPPELLYHKAQAYTALGKHEDANHCLADADNISKRK